VAFFNAMCLVDQLNALLHATQSKFNRANVKSSTSRLAIRQAASLTASDIFSCIALTG